MRMTVVFFLSLFFIATALPSFALELARDGKTAYRIFLDKDASTVEKAAAKELQTTLAEISGAKFEIVDEPGDGPLILVGDSAETRKLIPAEKLEFKYDGILIKTAGEHLVLTGHPQRGALYAVNVFLEDHLGCRWWTSTESYIPKKSVVEIPEIDHAYAPKLIYREAYYKDAFEGIFATRMKCNGSSERISPEYGGHHQFVYFVHSFYPLLPPDKYFAQHPEWYSEIDGKRKHEGGQLCLTNPEMRAELTKNAIAAIRKNPAAKFISISQNDWYGYCTCPECTKTAEAEDSQAGPLIQFLNLVAEEIEKEFPDAWVETLAYQYTRKPPKTLKPRDNVIIRLCTIECSFVQPLTGEQNKSLREDISGWSKIAKNLFVWDYVTNFSSYMIPHPNYRVLAPNIRFFVENNTIGLFEQGDSYCSAGDFVQLRNWVVSHLMWNPELDENKLIDEFLEGYYGKEAAPILREYFKTITDRAEASGVYLGCFRENTVDWLDFETLGKATGLLDEAIAKAAKKYGPEDAMTYRLRRAKMPIDHVWIKDYYPLKRTARKLDKPFTGPEDPQKTLDEFFALCEHFKVDAHREYNHLYKFDDFKKNMYARFGPPAVAPEICKGLDPDSWYDFQEFEFNVHRNNNWADAVDDKNASNGRAVRMPGDHFEWACSLSLDASLKPGKYRVVAFVRCEGETKDGTGMSMGIYDYSEKKGIITKSIPVAEIEGTTYNPVEIGTFELRPGMNIWFAPPKRPGEIEAVYIDRIVLIE